MAGPWDNYASQTLDDSAPAGPWAKYQDAGTAAPAGSGFLSTATKSTIDSLPMIGGMVGGILGTPADIVAGPMGNVAGAAAGGYVGTAAKNLINRYYDPQSAPQTNTQAITQPMVGGLEQGLMQGVGEGVAPYINKGIQAVGGAVGGAAKWAGAKLLSNIGGVSPDGIKEYAQFSGRINSAPSVDALKGVSDDFVEKLASDVDAKKLTADQAQEALKGFQSDLKDQYKTAGYDARDAVTSAQQTLKDAHNARIQQVSGDVYNTINQLKSDVQAGSGSALNTLNNSNAQVDLSPVYRQIDSTMDRLRASGTDESIAVANKLQNYKTRLMGNNWASIPAPMAKPLIQGIDQITAYSPMAGNFDKAQNAAFKSVRSVLDQQLKSAVPEYKAAMMPVANDTDLLNRVEPFADRQSGASILQRINAPNQSDNLSALHDLGKRYGTDFVSGVQSENLPQHRLLQNAQAAQDALRPDIVSNKIDQALAASRQQAAYGQAQSDLATAQDNLAPFKSLAPNAAGQTQAQQKLAMLTKPNIGAAAQVGKGSNIELTDMFQRLGALTDTDFVQAMHDQGIQAAFQKGAYNGSRNAVRGGALGFLIGGVPGAAGGVALGGLVDQWGPAITKKLLDGAIQVSKHPTVATIAGLEIPEAAKRNMIVGLENYLSQGAVPVSQQLVAKNQTGAQTNRIPAKGPDAWAQQGLQSLGIQDAGLSSRVLADPKGKQMLINASSYRPGSPQLKNIMKQIQSKWGNSQ